MQEATVQKRLKPVIKMHLASGRAWVTPEHAFL